MKIWNHNIEIKNPYRCLPKSLISFFSFQGRYFHHQKRTRKLRSRDDEKEEMEEKENIYVTTMTKFI